MPGYVKTDEEVARIEAFLKPSRFMCDEIGIEFKTTWEFARSILPPIFEPTGDEAEGTCGGTVQVTSFESAYCGPMDWGVVSLLCSYNGIDGYWMLTEIVEPEFPVVIGRELWGEVKKTGSARFWRDGNYYRGVAERRGLTLLEIEAEIDGPEQGPFQSKGAGFDIKMFPHANAQGLQYPPLLNIWDITLDYHSYRDGTGTLRWGESEWDPTFTIPIHSVGKANACQYAGYAPLGQQIPLEDPDNIYPRYLWGRAYDEPTRFPIARRWQGVDELNDPPVAAQVAV
jgi:acetoacetate decarboxylase